MKLDGCDYRIPKLVLLNFLAFYGEIKSEITEDLFDDGSNPELEADGTNRTGTYSVKIQIKKPIPQLLPILGRRVKIHYPGVQRLCTKCFGKHPKQACQSPKVTWSDYVRLFIGRNPDITKQLFGKWYHTETNQAEEVCYPDPSVQNNTKNPNQTMNEQKDGTSGVTHNAILTNQSQATFSQQGKSNPDEKYSQPTPSTSKPIGRGESQTSDQTPTAAAFLVPSNETEQNLMIEKMMLAGLLRSEAELNIAARKTAYNKAIKDFKKTENKQPKFTKRNNKSKKHVNKSLDDYGS